MAKFLINDSIRYTVKSVFSVQLDLIYSKKDILF